MLSGKSLPMIYPPRDWRRCDDGGYLTMPSFLMRIKENPNAVNNLMRAERGEKLGKVFEALNFLGSVSWSILNSN